MQRLNDPERIPHLVQREIEVSTPEPGVAPGNCIYPAPNANMARRKPALSIDKAPNTNRTQRNKSTPKPNGRVLQRIHDKFNKEPEPTAHGQ